VDARLVALTNVDLDEAVRRRAFREDLFYRLNVVRIHVPPLRERREDIPALAESFLALYAAKHGRRANVFEREAATLLGAYDWPGNVRELSNVVERAVIVSEGARVGVEALPESVLAGARAKERAAKRPTLAEVEAEYIRETLAAAGGNKSEAARLLGISRKNLYERLRRTSDEG
jgi:DNA-binding NtrC family response regulator